MSSSVPDLELLLNCGHSVHLNALYQRRTYEGMLCGLPNEQINDILISGVIEDARNVYSNRDPYLIPPKVARRTSWKSGPTCQVSEDADTDARIGLFLPAITCMAVFAEIRTTKRIAAVWFQDHFALPIAQDIVNKLQAIDWSKHSMCHAP